MSVRCSILTPLAFACVLAVTATGAGKSGEIAGSNKSSLNCWLYTGKYHSYASTDDGCTTLPEGTAWEVTTTTGHADRITLRLRDGNFLPLVSQMDVATARTLHRELGNMIATHGNVSPEVQPANFTEDVRYFPASPDIALVGRSAITTQDPFGMELFSNVSTAWFVGPSMPANKDGSYGRLSADDHGATITIYERYIVREAMTADGHICRAVYPYETLGRFEQHVPRRTANALTRQPKQP